MYGDMTIMVMTEHLILMLSCLWEIFLYLLSFTGIMIVLSLIIALLISKRVSKSIIVTNESAKELAKGNFDVEFGGKDCREIAELSDTLNRTAKELAKTDILQKELIANLVNDLLDMSKLQAGVTSLEMKLYDITAGINAVNYTGCDKTIKVKQIVENSMVRIEVIDTGEGIPEYKLENVWERYYKVDKNHKRAIMGSGIGLSIVKNILILYNAKYGVDSEEGKGSTFWFELPITEEDFGKEEKWQ